MTGEGHRNLITDVAGIRVGNAEDNAARTGVTVVLPDAPADAAVDVCGGGTGTRELALLEPSATAEAIHAIVFSGGSAFGLSAADGVMSWLAARGRGLPVGEARVPIVPAAILFDLLNGGDKEWGDDPPYRRLGAQAAEAAGRDFALGNAGAGLGASSGPGAAGGLKGGLGSASCVAAGGFTIGALAAVNSCGSVLMPDTGTFWAWPFERGGEYGGRKPPIAAPANPDDDVPPALPGHQHDAGRRRHRCRADQGAGPARGDHGAGRARPRHPAGAYALRRRCRVRHRHRAAAIGA